MVIVTGVLSWVLLALLGLISAILCIALPFWAGSSDLPYVGTVYGVLLAIYFFTSRGIRSAEKLIPVVFFSAIAWPVASIGSGFALFIPGSAVGNGVGIEPAFPLIAFGGLLGAWF